MSGNTARMASLLALVGLAAVYAGPSVGRPVSKPHQALKELGMLTCSLAETDAEVGGQSRDVLCRFRPSRQALEETYAGTMQSIGRTQEIYGRGTIILAVRGPASTRIEPGLLQQAYAADASRASAAAPLIGEQNRTLVLQPLLEEEGRVAAGKTRPDAVIIRVELRLKSSPA